MIECDINAGALITPDILYWPVEMDQCLNHGDIVLVTRFDGPYVQCLCSRTLFEVHQLNLENLFDLLEDHHAT